MRSLLNYLEDVPLTRLLSLVLAIILVCTLSIIGIIAAHFASRIMTSVVEEAARHSALEIQSETDHFLEIADQSVKNTALAFRANRVNINNPDTLSRYLWDRAIDKNSDLVSAIYYASEQGHIMSVSVPELDDQYHQPRVRYSSGKADLMGHEYALSANGALGQVIRELGQIDPRTRPWYRQARQADGEAVWSAVYQDYDSAHLVITRSLSVSSDDGTLLGVAAIDLYLEHFQDFLNSLSISRHSKAFIYNENRWLLASNVEEPDRLKGGGLRHVSRSIDPTIRAAYEAITQLPSTIDTTGSSLIPANLEGVTGHLFIRDVGRDYGVNWKLVMFLPSADFIGSTGKDVYLLIFLILVVVSACIATIFGFLTLVVSPLNRLTADAKRIAAGQFDVPIRSHSKNEVGELSRFIANMQAKLKTNIAHLKEANMLLKRENNRIETTLGSLDDGVITFGEDGTIQFMNRAAERKTGCSIKIARGSSIRILGNASRSEPSQRRFQNAIAQAMEGYEQQNRATLTTLYQDDSGISVSCRLTALIDSQQRPQGALLVFNELTELLQLKLEHEQTVAVHRQLAHVVEETANEIYVVEPDTFRITMMNRTARVNLGYTLKESQRLTLQDTVHEFETTFPTELINDFTSGHLSRKVIDTIHYRKDGSLYPTETRLHYVSDTNPPYFALIAQDTTERLSQIQDLLLRDRAIAAIDVGVFIIEQNKMSVLYVNQAMTAITGYPVQELIGRSPSVFAAGEDENGNPTDPWQRSKTDSLLQFNQRCQRKDTSHYEAELSLSYMRDTNGQVTHCIGIIEDVSGRMAAEKKLRHAQKFDAIGRLSGGIAHDFNNLLNIVSGRLEFLSALASDEACKLHIQEAERAANMGARLTRRLLAFARQGPMEQDVINLNEVLSDTLIMLETTLANRISVKTDLEMDLWPVHTDRSAIENAVINLTINARDAMPAGGTVVIRTDNASIKTTVGLKPAIKAGDYVCLSITDSGNGMNQETLSQIFEPFFTTKEPGKGTGLGLASIFGFARQSGGDVIAESSLESGTSITIYLPRYTGDIPVAQIRGNSAQRHEAGKFDDDSRRKPEVKQIRVLVVEDNLQVLELTNARMRALGLNVNSVSSGVQAIEHINQGHAYDLLFCDVILENGISGYEVADKMYSQNQACKILLTSGFSEAMLMPEQDSSSDWPILEKPYRAAQLESTINALFADSPALCHPSVSRAPATAEDLDR